MELSSRIRESFKTYGDREFILNSDSGVITYGLFLTHCQKILDTLNELGLKEGDKVAILSPKTVGSTAALLACAMNGTTYVPCDGNNSLFRVGKIINSCGARFVIGTEDQLHELSNDVPIDLGSHITVAGSSIAQVDAESHGQGGSDAAFILHTSGSTGSPKGVLISSKNALAFVDWCVDQFNISDSDVIASIAPYHFDLSVFDLYATISTGARLVLFDDNDLKNPMLAVDTMSKYQITICYCTPTLLNLFQRYGKIENYQNDLNPRLVLFAGEVYNPQQLYKLREVWGQAEYYNLYGPTETNVVTYFIVPDESNERFEGSFPIGWLTDFAEGMIVSDGLFNSIKEGEMGELVIAGDSVSQGYLDMPDETRSSQVIHEDKVYYKTGDWVEVDNRGRLIFKGRKDGMIKRRGYRIEIGEIEEAYSSLDFIEQCVVSPITRSGEIFLVAFILAIDNSKKGLVELKSLGMGKIPAYMLPDRFIYLTEFPMTSSKKIDRKKLMDVALEKFG